MAVPSGTEAVRPFLPAKDFEISRAFYEALGFTKLLDGDVAIFGIGASAFIIQRYYQEDWARNCMMQLMVDDLDGWWTRIESLDLPTKFRVQPPKAPAMQPWGLRVAYLFDPSGVLWHIAQRRENAPSD
jgi:hypothetical protein